MLQRLYQSVCAGSLLLSLRQGGHTEGVLVTPAFNEAGLLSAIAVEILPPQNVDAENPVPAPAAAPAAAAPPVAEPVAGQEQGNAGAQAAGGAALSGAIEFDPVTGQPRPKASEQV